MFIIINIIIIILTKYTIVHIQIEDTFNTLRQNFYTPKSLFDYNSHFLKLLVPQLPREQIFQILLT